MDIELARKRARDALRNLESHKARINDLNVYPVPDGDTGTNLTLTVRAIVDALESSEATGHEAVAKDLSRAALMGARGNSGVILSQIVRGLAEVLGEQDEIDSMLLARAFRSASDEAYRAIQRPVEGTMLTVIREMAEEAERPEVVALPKDELLLRIVERGEDAVRRTPDMLAKLREAGVVDAGGVGLVELIRGLYFSVAGIDVPEVAASGEGEAHPELDHEFSEFQYCTNFVLEGVDLDREALSEELCVGDCTATPFSLAVDMLTVIPITLSSTTAGLKTWDVRLFSNDPTAPMRTRLMPLTTRQTATKRFRSAWKLASEGLTTWRLVSEKAMPDCTRLLQTDILPQNASRRRAMPRRLRSSG